MKKMSKYIMEVKKLYPNHDIKWKVECIGQFHFRRLIIIAIPPNPRKQQIKRFKVIMRSDLLNPSIIEI